MAADLRSLEPIVAVPANGPDPLADTMVVPIPGFAPIPQVVPVSTAMTSTNGAGSPEGTRGTRGRRLAVVGALALALVVGLVTINAGSAGTDPSGAGAVAPTASASLVVAEPAPTVSPVTSDQPPAEPGDNGKGRSSRGKGNDHDND